MIVLDSSAAVEIVRGTDQGGKYESLMYTGEEVVSVDLFCGEVVSTFWKYVRAKSMSSFEAVRLSTKAIELVDHFYSMEDFYVETLNEAVRLGYSPYDIFFFVLARRMGATLFSADKRLSKLCLENGVSCVCGLDFGGESMCVRANIEVGGGALTREDLERILG